MKSTTGILGYFSPLSVKPNQQTELKISSKSSYECMVEILKVICADIDTNGPGEQYEKVSWFKKQKIGLKKQPINLGSFAIIDPAPDIIDNKIINIQLSVFPTMIKNTPQVIFHWGQFQIIINNQNKLCVVIGSKEILTCSEIKIREWLYIEFEMDIKEKKISLFSKYISPFNNKDKGKINIKKLNELTVPRISEPIILAARYINKKNKIKTEFHFNGKIDSPKVVDENKKIICHWDFTEKINSNKIIDKGPKSLNGILHNVPMRAATGVKWDGSCHSWLQDKEHYSAIHFHEDDISDCNWDTTIVLDIPACAKSGYYIARLLSKTVQSDVPFYISVDENEQTADILFIAPTATYLSYSNTHVKFDSHNTENLFEAPLALSEDELYLNKHRELGLSHYDTHADGSGVVYVSEKRPILNMRPGLYTFNYINDTHIIKWLESKKFDYDVTTDHELHNLGTQLLKKYKLIITASHPEYYSTEMWNAIYKFQNNGGRHMYLGGNGFYWKMAYSKNYPGVIENRRGASGVRTWEGEPGEHYLSFNGELGGLWRTNGRAPQTLVGIGFSATYFLKSTYFQKLDITKNTELDFIFKGIESDTFGDFGYRGGGCVGLEIDRFEHNLGSPKNTVVLATSVGVGSAGLLTGEEFITTTRALDGSQHAHVRADMTIFSTDSGGAVWSTGSIAWATSLLWNNCDNDVSTITENVINRFLNPEKIHLI